MKLFAFVLAMFLLMASFVLVHGTGSTRSVGHHRSRRTMGAGASFINCLAIGERAPQRICSHDLDLLDAIERQQKAGNRTCPEGKVFHRQCNVCKCRRDGALECSTDLCGEDFFDATGLPRYW